MTDSISDSAAFQVLVVGFGPSGAMAANLLGKCGIRTLVIDQSRTVYDKPRAIAIDHEIIRICDNVGVLPAISHYLAPFPASEHFGADGQLIRRIHVVEPPYPLGYTPTMVFSQPPVEAALREHAAAFESVHVELGTEFLSLEQSDERVDLHLKNDGGRTRNVTATYVIACDGAASSVRQHLGMTLDDLVFDEPWVVVDVLMHDSGVGKLPPTAAQYCDPARPATYIVGPANHRRWEIMLLPGEDPRAMEEPGQIWKLLSRWISPDDGTLWRAASYRFHALVARQWRCGRVLIAGDAAHQQPPFIGQGMAQGMRDVANLVWKLDRVLKGQSEDALLDTYGEERSAHVRELTRRIKAIGEIICERDPARARARDKRVLAEGGGKAQTITRQEIVPPLTCGLLASPRAPANGTLFPQPRVQTASGPCLLDAAQGTGWRLVTDGRSRFELGQEVRAAANALGARVLRLQNADGAHPDGMEQVSSEHAIVELDGVLARWFEANGCRAAIVRPDHYVYGVADDNAELASMLMDLRSQLCEARPRAGP
jgi:3-(3-hydroxy-phenyl)propionate hydroxylase